MILYDYRTELYHPFPSIRPRLHICDQSHRRMMVSYFSYWLWRVPLLSARVWGADVIIIRKFSGLSMMSWSACVTFPSPVPLLQSEQSPIVCLLHPSGLDIDFPGNRWWREWMLEGNTQPLLLVHDTTEQNLNFGQLTAMLASVLAFYQARLCGGRSFFHLLSTAALRSRKTLLQSWRTFSYYMCWA